MRKKRIELLMVDSVLMLYRIGMRLLFFLPLVSLSMKKKININDFDVPDRVNC